LKMEVTELQKRYLGSWFLSTRINFLSFLSSPDLQITDLGGQLITDPAGSGSYLDIFVTI
jgi:hypothetical protein